MKMNLLVKSDTWVLFRSTYGGLGATHMPMTSRERVLATFEFELVDMVPIHHIGFSRDAASKILRREVYVGGGIQQ
jgi:hypothetical protein